MPDKEIMEQIRAREEARPWSLLDALNREVEADRIQLSPAALAAVLSVLAGDWRDTAELYDKAKGKGFKTVHVEPLRHAARQLDEVIKGLDKPRRAPLGQIQPVGAPPAVPSASETEMPFPPAECPQVAAKQAHGGHNWIGGPQGSQDDLGARGWRWCSGHVGGPAERPGLDALIADSVRASGLQPYALPETPGHNWVDGRPALPPTPEMPEGGDAIPAVPLQRVPVDAIEHSAGMGVVTIDGEDVTAYLSGALAELPGPPPAPSTVRNTDPTTGQPIEPEPETSLAAALDDPAAMATYEALSDPRTITARENLTNMSPEIAAAIPPVPLLGQPGNAGDGYASTYVPPGGRLFTLADLLTPVSPAALPVHLSHSQISGVGECAAKYRMTRIEGNVEVPEWATIGGSAFHAVIEMLEQRELTEPGTASGDRVGDAEKLWSTYFDVEIGKIEESSPVPRSRWRASKQGAEGETWWRANGPLMIGRYLAARPAEPTTNMPGASGAIGDFEPAIEIERTVAVPTPYGPLPYKAIIDRVTVRTDPSSNWVTLVIRDYKSGASMPSDAQQLGEYANVLRLLGVPPQVRIVGTYFNARKGVWTPEVDLDAGPYTAEWFSYHVASGHAQRQALTFGPTAVHPTSFCGGCPVRYACPIKGVQAQGGAR